MKQYTAKGKKMGIVESCTNMGIEEGIGEAESLGDGGGASRRDTEDR